MRVGGEFLARIERLKEIIRDVLERQNKLVRKQGFDIAKVISQTPEVAIIETSMILDSGELVGKYRPNNDPEYLGFIIKELGSDDSGRRYVLNKSLISNKDIEDEFLICKTGFSHLYKKRYEALLRAEDIISRFDFAELRFTDSWEFSKNLDEYERMAAEASMSLEDDELLLVMGPPGTGKTEFISEASRILGEKTKVLVTSHSHHAVDNALERLPEGRLDYVLRVGPLVKISESVRRFSPEHKYLESIPNMLSPDELAEEYSRALRNVKKEQVGVLYGENFLIGATSARVTTNPLRNFLFDTVFIDEGHNLCLSTALYVMDRAKKVVITGDYWQIPPVYQGKNIRFQDRVKYGAFNFFYELLLREHRQLLWLRNHYRCNESIISFSSQYVYEGKLNVTKICKNQKLDVKQISREWLDPEKPLVFVDTLGEEEIDVRSRKNTFEAKKVSEIVYELIRAGVSPGEIVVLTPYNAQVQLIGREIRRQFDGRFNIEVRTVHNYLGGEKDVVIFSVTCTDPASMGFIDKRMVNVVVTRAKKKLIVVGNLRKLAGNQNAPIFDLIRYILKNGYHVRA